MSKCATTTQVFRDWRRSKLVEHYSGHQGAILTHLDFGRGRRARDERSILGAKLALLGVVFLASMLGEPGAMGF